MVRFMNDVIVKTSKILRKAVKEGKGLPDTVKMVDSNKKTRKVSKKQYMGIFEDRNVFCQNHGCVPNYVTYKSKANNPLVLNYQDNGHNCCPASLSMCIGFLFDFKSESECAKKLGTSTSGTAPDQLINNAPKLGVNAKKINRKWSSVKSSLDKGRPVIAHIQTKPATCLGYAGDYGHYIVIYSVYKSNGVKYYKIADPTKGLKVCKASVLDKATNGRDIHYYSIIPK